MCLGTNVKVHVDAIYIHITTCSTPTDPNALTKMFSDIVRSGHQAGVKSTTHWRNAGEDDKSLNGE